MYRSTRKQTGFEDFEQPAGMHLERDNRWVRMAEMIPWEDLEDSYAEQFTKKSGRPSHSARMVLGALLIQGFYQCSDRELPLMIQENPYLQYFCGMKTFDASHPPFSASALVSFRRRFSKAILDDINEKIIRKADEEAGNTADRDDDEDGGPGSGAEAPDRTCDASAGGGAEETAADSRDSKNGGTLILDATCSPADIRFPQDTSVLNEAREKAEMLIDRLHAQTGGRKPRTYRVRAAGEYKTFVRRRRPTAKQRRKMIRRQLGYLNRDLQHIRNLQRTGGVLEEKEKELLQVLIKVYEQQKYMYDTGSHKVKDRIVSISQPWIRPIVRGKAKNPTEFGPKIHMSDSDGWVRLEEVSYDAFNESTRLQECVEAYRERTGHYPGRVLADKIYRTRENLRYAKEAGFRLLGPKPGRPKQKDQEDREQMVQDGRDRIEIEREFSLAKRCCGMAQLKTHLQETNNCSLGISIILLNLKKAFRDLFDLFCRLYTIAYISEEHSFQEI